MWHQLCDWLRHCYECTYISPDIYVIDFFLRMVMFAVVDLENRSGEEVAQIWGNGISTELYPITPLVL